MERTGRFEVGGFLRPSGSKRAELERRLEFLVM